MMVGTIGATAEFRGRLSGSDSGFWSQGLVFEQNKTPGVYYVAWQDPAVR
jgi:hypothetical protein